MGLSIKDMRVELAAERVTVQGTLEMIKSLRESVKVSQKRQKELRAKIREEAQINRVVKEDARRLKRESREAKRIERIAKMEARLAKMKLQAGRKNGPVKVYSADEIAALNA